MRALQPVIRRVGSISVAEQAALLGLLNPSLLELARRPDSLSATGARGWVGTADPDGITISRTMRGATQRHHELVALRRLRHARSPLA